jgi:hypothetical protein
VADQCKGGINSSKRDWQRANDEEDKESREQEFRDGSDRWPMPTLAGVASRRRQLARRPSPTSLHQVNA